MRSASQLPHTADAPQRMTWDDYCAKIAEIAGAGVSRLADLDNDHAIGLATASSTQWSKQAEYIRNWDEDMRNERWKASVANSDALRSNLDSLLRRVQTETTLIKRRWVSLGTCDPLHTACMLTARNLQPTKTLFLKTSTPSAHRGVPASNPVSSLRTREAGH